MTEINLDLDCSLSLVQMFAFVVQAAAATENTYATPTWASNIPYTPSSSAPVHADLMADRFAYATAACVIPAYAHRISMTAIASSPASYCSDITVR